MSSVNSWSTVSAAKIDSANDVDCSDSVSNIGRVSNRSLLMAKRKALDKKHDLIRRKLEIEMQLERLELDQLDTELMNEHDSKPEATEPSHVSEKPNVYEHDSQPEATEPSHVSEKPEVIEPSHACEKPLAHDYSKVETAEPKKHIVGIASPDPSDEHHSTDMVDIIRELKKPPINIKAFSGEPPSEFRKFKRQFSSRIEKFASSADECLAFLEQFTTGKAHQIVTGFAHLDAEYGFPAAMRELEIRFGDTELVANSYLKRLNEWPIIKADDPSQLDQFSIFLTECDYATYDFGNLNLDYPDNIAKIVKKLPWSLHDKWRTVVLQTRERLEKVNFKLLCDFVRREAKKATDPVYGKTALNPERAKPQDQSHRKPKPAKSVFTTDVSGNMQPCIKCSEHHAIEQCKKMEELSLKDRYEFLRSKGICFGCLKPGHINPKCRNRATCNICSRRHPTLLHRADTELKTVGNENTELKSVASGCTQTSCSQNALVIVPVKVSTASGHRVIDTYAFMDPGSTASFITHDLRHKLGLEGKHTTINVDTMTDSTDIRTSAVNNVRVSNYELTDSVVVPTLYTTERIPVGKQHIPTAKDIEQFDHLRDVTLHMPCPSTNIDLLIGMDVGDAYHPLEILADSPDVPHASKTPVGWLLWNVKKQTDCNCTIPRATVNVCSVNTVEHRVPVTLDDINTLLQKSINLDFPESTINDVDELSVEDQNFMKKVSAAEFKDGHYEIPLPFRNDEPVLPNNIRLAENRLECLRKRMSKDDQFRQEYTAFMNNVLEKGFAEEVDEPDDGNPPKTWYLPHHGVYHKQKGKLRVVFDCSAKHEGVSLNDSLLQGPDMTNNLTSVLMRFRLEPIALTSDIESMFHQVKVPPHHRDFLRFLWWPNGDIESKPKIYRMTVHLFGAVSSPSCANYALRRTATDNAERFEPDIVNTVLNDFYVDDCLKSVRSEWKAVNDIHGLSDLCDSGGFRLHKWMSNSQNVINTVPEVDRARCEFPSLCDSEPVIERALGVHWDVTNDSLMLHVNVPEKPITRRGILSVVSSVYDPLGLVSPVILPAKIILRELCSAKLEWDQPIDHEQHLRLWKVWLDELPMLSKLRIPRCIKPSDFGTITSVQLHHFSDASEIGYGMASYLRLTDRAGNTCCSLIFSKSRVAPLKMVTVPRMELTAAAMTVKLSKKIESDFLKDTKLDKVVYWTDSTTVLRYISNEQARYKTFVANRVAVIREATSMDQWKYVNTRENPADDASRGISARSLMDQERWFRGPDFLREDESNWPREIVSSIIPPDDTEVKKSVNAIVERPLSSDPVLDDDKPCDSVDELIAHYSDFNRLKRAVASILRVKQALFNRTKGLRDDIGAGNDLTFLERAEVELIKHEQVKYLSTSYHSCESTKGSKRHSIAKLDPYIDEKGLMRVGGRLSVAEMCLDSKHQIIVPRQSMLSVLLVRRAHAVVGHLGRNAVLAELRKRYWITGASAVVRSVISRCVTCRRYAARASQQKMADLPLDRLTPCKAPFDRTGMDFFGPFEIKRGRTIHKRYGVIFTCLNSRSVHLEVATSMDTDSCINAIRRFIARRGKPSVIRSDNGTNIVGAQRELKDAIRQWNSEKIQQHLLQKGIEWKFNPPHSSHFGGCWERLIRIVRKVLYSLQRDQLDRLCDESFATLMCEVEAVLNSRPITKVAHSHMDFGALTPNHLMLPGREPIHAGDFLPPVFTDKTDCYSKKRWRQVQYLTDIFWKRWIKEYVPLLQERQKWMHPKRNMCKDDIVLITDTNIRNSWILGRVISVDCDKNKLVRKATVQTRNSVLCRPVDKLVTILESDSV